MDARAAKLALARQKLKSHQEKKQIQAPKTEVFDEKKEYKTSDLMPVEHIPMEGAAGEECEKLHVVNTQTTDINVNEILISTKYKLEQQVQELQSKLLQLENNYTFVVNNNSYFQQQVVQLENELKSLQDKYNKVNQELMQKDTLITELMNSKTALYDENNNLQEQLEFTKTILTAKESENGALQNQLLNLQSQLDATQLQLQQIMNGSQFAQLQQEKNTNPDLDPEILTKRISCLEHELKLNKKEKDQMSVHYEQYMNELNEQLRNSIKQNTDLESKLRNLSDRENSLIEQISEMEIRIQALRQKPVEDTSHHIQEEKNENLVSELQEKCAILQEEAKSLSEKCLNLEIRYAESQKQLHELQKVKEAENNHENISLSKLTADMASDKLAAQRATEQNKKLKIDLQELEEAFVKISQDKLDLTEKLAAEKFLNRELTIKLADVDEKAKDMHRKLLAKDEEMIRLQNSYKELTRNLAGEKCFVANKDPEINDNEHNYVHTQSHHKELCEHSHNSPDKNSSEHDHSESTEQNSKSGENTNDLTPLSKIPKQDAMLKLQDRFLKIMDEVANLSDEKHRLEHIILQLQNETDTICEYVALYQQQRCLLKKRDEERSAQIKIFQNECSLLKRQLEELSGIIIKLAQDTELAPFFKNEPRQSDLEKVMNLLSNLRANTLIDPCKTSSELKNFYPCSCCSGQLIEV